MGRREEKMSGEGEGRKKGRVVMGSRMRRRKANGRKKREKGRGSEIWTICKIDPNIQKGLEMSSTISRAFLPNEKDL